MAHSSEPARDALTAELEAMTRLQQVGSLCCQPGADFDACLGVIVEAAIALTGAIKGNIQLLDEATGTLRIAAHRGFQKPFLDFFAQVRDEPSSCGTSMRSGERTLIEDVSRSRVFAGTESEKVLSAEGIEAVQSTPLKSSNGRLLGMISTHYDAPHRFSEAELRRIDLLALQAADFVERMKAEDALRVMAVERDDLLAEEQAARVEAERAGRLKDEFLATLSHELRSPIQAVLGWVHLLRKNPGPEDLELGLQTIERNSRAQAQIISDLLDMSWIMSGRLRLDVQPISYGAIIDEAVASVQPAAAARNIRIGLHLDPLTGLVPRGDPARLQQVVRNLLDNAVEFTPHGGEIRIFLDRAGGSIELKVADSGIGIDQDSLAHVFELFRCEERGAHRRSGGPGIGLAIVKSLVEAHGGSVRVESAGEGYGATFIVEIPLDVNEQARGSRPAVGRLQAS